MRDLHIKAFLDTGSTISIISPQLFKKLGIRIIPRSSVKINMVTGNTTSIGRIKVPLTIQQITKIINLHVVHGFRQGLLIGLDVGSLYDINVSLRTKSIIINHHSSFAARIIEPEAGPTAEETSPKIVSLSVSSGPTPCSVNAGPTSGPANIHSSSSNFVTELLHQFSDIFATEADPVGSIPNVQHSIITNTSTPIYVKPYRKPQTEHDRTRTIVQDLLKRTLIRSSISPYGFPSTLATKKNGEPRLCIDYRELNKVTVSDKYSIPQIQDVLDRLQGCQIFSTLDMAWGYWHIKMEPASIPKTAFITQDGHFEWMVMPFGLKNAPSTLQRVLRTILGDLSYKCTINYLDDIIVYSKTEEDHKQNLRQVLSRLRMNNIKLRKKKCSFMTEHVEFLGFKIHKDSVSPNPDKVKALRDYPVPRTRKQVQRFLGLCSYFRSHIPRYTESAFPLTKLTRKQSSFQWNQAEIASFETLKKSLMGPAVLKIFNPVLPTELHTDASKVGIGSILIQRNADGTPRVISFFSKRLSKEQENWSTTDQEGLAIVESIEKFDCYLRPFKFTVYTDNSSLTWIANSSKLKGRLLRWFLRLQPYTFDIFHRKGSLNQHVDALSRAPVNPPSASEPLGEIGIITDHRKMGNKESSPTKSLSATVILGPDSPIEHSTSSMVTCDVISNSVQQMDSESPVSGPVSRTSTCHQDLHIPVGPVQNSSGSSFLDSIHQIMSSPGPDSLAGPAITLVASVKGWNPNHALPFSEDTLRTAQEAADLSAIRNPVIRNGVIHIRDKKKNKRKVVPPSLINTVLRFYHENHGHFAKDKTSRMVNRYYWWPSIGKDITAHVDSCHECQMLKPPSGPGLGNLQLMPTPNKPFQLLSLDTMSIGAAAHNTSHKYVQVLIDHHSRFVWTVATKKNDAQAAINAMNKAVDYKPRTLITDNGSNFASKEFRSYLVKHKIQHIFTTTYHPASNGMVERVNRTLKERLSFLKSQNPKLAWSTLLSDATGIYNSTLHDITGFTPRFLLTGDEEVPDGAHQVPLDIAREQAAVRTASQQRRRKELYDKQHLQVTFEPGDRVIRKIPKNHPDYQDKLAPKNLGPFLIVKKTGPVNYLIVDPVHGSKPVSVHLDQLAPYVDRTEPANASLSHHGGGCDGPDCPQG